MPLNTVRFARYSNPTFRYSTSPRTHTRGRNPHPDPLPFQGRGESIPVSSPLGGEDLPRSEGGEGEEFAPCVVPIQLRRPFPPLRPARPKCQTPARPPPVPPGTSGSGRVATALVRRTSTN